MSAYATHRARAQPRHGLSVTAAPSGLPLTLAQVKAFLRVDFPDDDATIRAQISAAARYLGETRGVAFLTTTYRQMFDGFPAGELLLVRQPVTAVTQIEYTDPDGATQILAPAGYVLGLGTVPARVVPAPGTVWPATQVGAIESVRVDFTAGYGANPGTVPDDAREALMQVVAILYACRTISIDAETAMAIGAIAQGVWPEWLW